MSQKVEKVHKGRGGQKKTSKSPKLPRGGGGGQEECGLFPLFGTFFNWNASLRLVNLFRLAY